MNILVTGGAGFIGSHVCVKLLLLGHKVLVIDNLSNSHLSSLKSISEIVKTNLDIDRNLNFYHGDIRDQNPLKEIFSKNSIDVVIHLAGLKSVKESVEHPKKYYSNNVNGSINLFSLMRKFNCKTVIFSSSATVYGPSNKMPVNEKAELSPINPYGENKKNIEDILLDLYNVDKSWKIAILRFFNPIGAHESGLIGENPLDLPNNLMPFILKVASRELEKLNIFGDDYDTHDGTGVRDYIHVDDLADGHVKAIEALINKPQVIIANLGTGIGYSVHDVIRAFEKVTNQKINFKVIERRLGDVASSYSDPSFAKTKLNWQAKKGLEEMCYDAWKYKLKNIL
jgi:UDP-glucose 4-epimerase